MVHVTCYFICGQWLFILPIANKIDLTWLVIMSKRIITLIILLIILLKGGRPQIVPNCTLSILLQKACLLNVLYMYQNKLEYYC